MVIGNNHKLLEIDILRAISALAVITIHVSAKVIKISVFNSLQISIIYIGSLAAFAVPCFIFISGLVLYKNYNELQGNYLQFYKKRFIKILPIYLLFSLFYIIFYDMKNLILGREVDFDIINICYKLITFGAHNHFWFFGILFQFYLIYPLFLKLYKKYKIKVLVMTFFLQYVWPFYSEESIKYIGKIIGNENLTFPFFFSHIFWFALGFYFLDNKEKILGSINVKIGVVIIVILNIIKILPFYYGLQKFNYYTLPDDYFTASTAIDTIFFLIEILVAYKVSIIILNKNNIISKFFIKIGFYSLEIYLIHVIMILFTHKTLNILSLTHEDILFYPILWIVTILLSYQFALIYNKIKLRIINKS